jgi:Protein of unknown function (DUF2917)
MTGMLALGKSHFGTYSLSSGETVVLPPRANARLRVHDGVVWATSTGDLDDIWLRAGEEYSLADKGSTVIESTARATIELMPAAANDMIADVPALQWSRAAAWLDDTGTLVALAAIVAVMVTAASRVVL